MDLDLLARRLPPTGVTVVRFEQPWRTAGRKVAVPPARLDGLAGARWAGCCRRAWSRAAVFGGRSAGARVACRTAPALRGRGGGLPGLPAASARPAGEVAGGRAAHAGRSTAGAAGHQGHVRHARPRSAQAIGDARQISVVELPGADHSFRVAKAAEFSAGRPARSWCDAVVASVSGCAWGITGAEPR